MFRVNQLIGFGNSLETSKIKFVGYAKAGKAGAFSGTTTLALNSGLAGGTRSSVQQGDFVLAVMSSAATSDVTLSITDGTTNYNLIATELRVNGTTYDVNLRAAYKFMGVTPDASTTFGPSGSSTAGAATAVLVFEGINSTTPLDVTATTATGIGSGYPNPAAISPITSGCYLVGIGSFTEGTGSASLTNNGQYDQFFYQEGGDDDDSHLGIGYRSNLSIGSFDPAVFTGTGSNSNGSWGAITIALRSS